MKQQSQKPEQQAWDEHRLKTNSKVPESSPGAGEHSSEHQLSRLTVGMKTVRLCRKSAK